jgi:hypothetical protein
MRIEHVLAGLAGIEINLNRNLFSPAKKTCSLMNSLPLSATATVKQLHMFDS